MNALWRSAWKDVLAIAPIWVGVCLTVAAAPLWDALYMSMIAMGAYVFGTVAIGAHVFGHEYAHRTLGSLLSQPIRRSTIVVIKLGVLAIALIVLTAVASAGPYSPIARFPQQATFDSRIVYLPTLIGLTLAPYLALVARSTLGGAVFSIGVPGLLVIGTDLIGVWTYGTGSPGEIDRFKYEVFPAATVAACAFAAVALWRRFHRLEALGDGGSHVSLPALERSGARDLRRSPHNPLWLLLGKELRLQQMSFVVAVFYVLGFAALWWFEQRPSEYSVPMPWQPLMAIHGCLVSMLIGALASAEERQFGTLEWQSLMPVSRRAQFALKAAVVIGLSILSAVVLPAAVSFILVTPFQESDFFVWMCLTSAACAVGALYVSSMTSSGVKAVALALPFVVGAFMLLRTTSLGMGYAARYGWIDRSWVFLAPRLTHAQDQIVAAFVIGWIAIVALTFAHRNHWTPGKTMRDAVVQCATIAAAVVIGGVAMTLLGFR